MKNRFRDYLRIQLVVAVSVFAIFSVLPDKQLASLLTSSLFLGSCFLILWLESRFVGFLSRATFLSTLAFLLLLAIPIFLFRILFWGVPFLEIEWLGFRPALLHQVSNVGFLLMLVCYFIDSFLSEKKQVSSKLQKEQEK
jgi:hypothetical protein